MFCSIRIPYLYAYHCWSALMTGFLSITFSSLDRFMYYTTVRCCFISLCSKPFKDRFIYPVPCHSAFLLAKEPSCRSASVLSDAPFFGVGIAKVVTYFLLTKFAVRKVPLPRLIHPPLPLSQPALHHAWQNPYFWVATARVITYFLLTKSFGKNLLFLRRFFPLYPYNKQIFIRSNCSKDSGGTSCSENPYRIPRLGIKERSVTTLRLYRLLNRAALAWAATLRSGCVCKGNTFFAENNTPLHFYRLIPPHIAPYLLTFQQHTPHKMSYQQQSNL